MSIRAMIQVGVLLDSFMNIDLPEQGLCQLRVKVYYSNKDNSRVLFNYINSLILLTRFHFCVGKSHLKVVRESFVIFIIHHQHK